MAIHKNSWSAFLYEMKVGERRYVETSFKQRHAMMKMLNSAKSRRPKEMEGMTFSTSLYTAISAADCSDVRYLILVERTA